MTERGTILVTGASKGIGRAIAIRLGKDGFRIVVHYGADAPGAAATLAEIEAAGGAGRTIAFDISDLAECRTKSKTTWPRTALLWRLLNAGSRATMRFRMEARTGTR